VIRGPQSLPTGALLAIEDITAQRQAQAELQAAEERLRRAQKMEALGRLVGGVAHNFNNLLMVTMGYTEMLLERHRNVPEDRADLEEIHRAAARGELLTRQLLTFGYRHNAASTRIDLNRAVTDLRGMLTRVVGDHIQLTIAVAPAAMDVLIDLADVEQLVVNLVTNARDALPNGGTIHVELEPETIEHEDGSSDVPATPQQYVRLRVRDNGTGMTPEVQARLFEPFFTTKEPGKGTGMSMATVHGIVMRSGGSVGVSSEVGKGTTFKVYFPSAEFVENATEAASAARLHFGGETVLLVEDSEGLRELAQRLLARQGYTVIVAANAEEALRLFDENVSIDLVLTDVVMPGASGATLAKQLMERRPAVKVIYMSGYTEDVITQHGVLQPGIAFLHKPFTSDTLGQKIRDVLDAGLR
jgi:signal transduction histidine kinase